jgi:hypothetical protein
VRHGSTADSSQEINAEDAEEIPRTRRIQLINSNY